MMIQLYIYIYIYYCIIIYLNYHCQCRSKDRKLPSTMTWDLTLWMNTLCVYIMMDLCLQAPFFLVQDGTTPSFHNLWKDLEKKWMYIVIFYRYKHENNKIYFYNKESYEYSFKINLQQTRLYSQAPETLFKR